MTVETTDGVEFSAAARCAAVANSRGSGACSKGFREEDTTLMEVVMLIRDVISQIAYDPGLDGMGDCTPFVGGGRKDFEAARMRKMEFLALDFYRSLVSGRSDICFEWEEGVASWECNWWRERSIRGIFIGHGVLW
jgi:hypothetical protein